MTFAAISADVRDATLRGTGKCRAKVNLAEVDILDTVERLQISDIMIIPFWI